MNNNSFHLAYSIDNQDVAQSIDNHLSRVGIHLDHIVVTHDLGEIPLRERLKDAPHFILLLVSDNLIKNMNAMNRGLFMIQELTLNQRVQPIIVDGRHRIKGTDTFETVPTLFDRMSYVIRYMNFWQDKYLDMRKARRDIPKEEEEPFDQQLKIVRAISSEMGDFLKTLKNNSHWSYDQLTHNAYELFFQAMNKPGLHDALKLAIANGEIPKVTPTPLPPVVEKKQIDQQPTEVRKEETKAEEIEIKEVIDTPTEEIKTEIETPTEVPPLPEEVIAKEEIPSFTPEITPREDDELLKISEQQLKKKGKTPLLDKLLQHRKEEEAQLQKNKIQPNKVSSEFSTQKIIPPVQEIESANNKDELFEQTINDIIEEENKIVEPPKVETPKINLREDSLLGTIFHDDDAELDSDSMIADFSLSTAADSSKKKSKKKNWQAQLNEAEQIIKEGKLYAGLNLIRESVEKNQENGELRYKYAIHLMDGAESHKAAKRELEKVILLDKKNTDAFYRLALLAEKKGDHLLAKNYYEKAIELNSSNANLYYRLGLLISNHFPDLQDQAYNYFKKSIKRDENNADAHYRIGLILDEHFKKPKKAMQQFETTLELQPEHPFVNYDLALMNYRFGAFKKAAQFYKKACKINPEFKTETNDRAFLSNVKNKKTIDLPSTSEDFLHDFSQSTLTATPLESQEDLTTKKEAKRKRNENFEKVVLISGSTSGIGKATATLFAKNGFRVILTGRRAERLADLKKEFEEHFPTKIKTLEFDVRQMDAAQKAIKSLGKDWSNIDILINNAGLAKGFDPIHEGNLDDWETMIDTNVKGLLYLTRLVSPGMVERRKGHIINVCSTAGHEVYPKGNVYCATKHAVDALTKGMRLDLYQHGLRVSQVSPAHVEETEFARVRFDWDVERAKIYKDFQPLRSEDVANTIYFIATQPDHVNIQDVLMMGKQQANSTNIDRSGR